MYFYLVGILSFSFLLIFLINFNIETKKIVQGKGKGCLTDKGYQG